MWRLYRSVAIPVKERFQEILFLDFTTKTTVFLFFLSAECISGTSERSKSSTIPHFQTFLMAQNRSFRGDGRRFQP
jgi:hypothetical protein